MLYAALPLPEHKYHLSAFFSKIMQRKNARCNAVRLAFSKQNHCTLWPMVFMLSLNFAQSRGAQYTHICTWCATHNAIFPKTPASSIHSRILFSLSVRALMRANVWRIKGVTGASVFLSIKTYAMESDAHQSIQWLFCFDQCTHALTSQWLNYNCDNKL